MYGVLATQSNFVNFFTRKFMEDENQSIVTTLLIVTVHNKKTTHNSKNNCSTQNLKIVDT